MRNLAVDKPNLFIDSGLGGLTTLFQTQALLPNEDFIYCADFKNSPYGNKTLKQIQNIVLHTLKHYYAKFKPKSVVFACNTATATTIQEVRKRYPSLVVVGAEPAIKPAIKSDAKKILVLCTKITLNQSNLVKLFRIHKKDILDFCVLPELATLIDNNYSSNPQLIHKYLVEKLATYKGKVEGVVLGCTHYIIVGENIKHILGNVKLFDGNMGIANRLKQCLDMLDLLKDSYQNDQTFYTQVGKNMKSEKVGKNLNSVGDKFLQKAEQNDQTFYTQKSPAEKRNSIFLTDVGENVKYESVGQVKLISTDQYKQSLLLQNYQHLLERRKELCVV